MEKHPANFSTMNSSRPHQTVYALAGGFQTMDAYQWTFLIPTAMVAICLIGIVGNLCVMGILLYTARKAKPSLIHSLIMNLSISDLLLLVFSVPFRVAAYTGTNLSIGWFVCKTAHWFTHACMSAKSITIAVIAKACFTYASNPAKQVTIKQQTVCAVLLSVWMVVAILPLPEWIFTTTKLVSGSPVCVMDIPSQAHELMAVFVKLYPVCVYCIPFTIAFFYFRKAYGQCRRRGTKTQNLRNQIRSRRLTVMLLGVTVAFAIMWLPEWVSWLWIWHQLPNGPSPPKAFVTLAEMLMLSLSSVNPLILLIMSEEFKEGFKDLWNHLISNKTKTETEPDVQDQDVGSGDLPGGEVSPEATKDGCADQTDSLQNFGSQDSTENQVLPDVEQFWHEREGHSNDQDNDPIPWEHQDQETITSNKSGNRN
ncbi:G-protein coupled receptor 151 [Bombina bombina]|uniref:G-protein coupled receptor 151 n=1 Tax=Bombina bombina TaxID=8345 RepID=UPI00235A8832|nr:G-protein coupled receptor 151 [Bombina bombina]